MANFGRPNTNNSQFFIASVECYHLDGTNVVFGQVKKGLSIISEMEKYASDEGIPKRPIIIYDCGEIPANTDWGYCDNDITSDKLPPFPGDYEKVITNISINEKVDLLNSIKESGNVFYRNNDFVKSARKYKKLTRYYNYFKDSTTDKEEIKTLDAFQLVNLTNLAATELKLEDYEDVIYSSTAAINIDSNNTKVR